jgi:c-type cytochrome biogenesis protein CcmF
VQIFFLLLVNFAANPFGLLEGPLRADGSGLNPLLQYPEMVIHPPMLYLGYVGFTVPFAFALGALIMKYPGEKWIHITRRWTMVTWGFLTCGIFLGAHWAYAVLGWGGYWGWDPVENASLMPWLVGTAFLHSVMMQEKRGMLKVWNMWLVFATFWLAILGTFLTRSGIISLGPRLRAVVDRNLVRLVPFHQLRGFRFLLLQEQRSPAQRAQTRIADLPRIELPVQQPSLRAALLHRSLGNMVPERFPNSCKATKSPSARLFITASPSRSRCCS